MDRLDAMAVFIAVAEGGSLSAGARSLGMPLPTVSRKISELEAHLRARLIERTTRRLTLTAAGQDYLGACRRILEEVREAERTASGEYTTARGRLTLSAPIVFGRLHVLPIVAAFLSAYPDISVSLTLADRLVDLQEERVDLALRIGPLPDSALVATAVGTVRQVVCASPSYLRNHGTPVQPDDLHRFQCVRFEDTGSQASWSFLVGGKDIEVSVPSRLSVNTAEAAIDAAIAGVGITRVLSYQVHEALRRGTLELLLEACEPSPRPVSLVFYRPGALPLKLRAFIDFAAPRLRTRLASLGLP